MTWQPERILEQLAGRWMLERIINDGSRFTGQAVFTPEDNQLNYREDGTLQLANGQRSKAYREYLYRAAFDGFTVWFPDSPPRLFQTVTLSKKSDVWSGQAQHDCPPDTYDSRYVFAPDSSFCISHAVQGPRKAYRMVGTYQRLAY